MNKELCFIIEDKELYLEHVLVDFNEIPVFYVCSNDKEFYTILCTDIENEEYIVVKSPLWRLCNLLEGTLEMREIFTKEQYYWRIKAAEDVADDDVSKKVIEALDDSMLPVAGAFYTITNEGTKKFLNSLESIICDEIGKLKQSWMALEDELSCASERMNLLSIQPQNIMVDMLHCSKMNIGLSYQIFKEKVELSSKSLVSEIIYGNAKTAYVINKKVIEKNVEKCKAEGNGCNRAA